jgi:hypothetical protein
LSLLAPALYIAELLKAKDHNLLHYAGAAPGRPLPAIEDIAGDLGQSRSRRQFGRLRCRICAFAHNPSLVASVLNLEGEFCVPGGSDYEASNDYWVRRRRSTRCRRYRRHHAVPLALDRGIVFKGLTVDPNKVAAADFDDRWSAMSASPPHEQTWPQPSRVSANAGSL